MEIEIGRSLRETGWQVKLNSYAVSFRSKNEAQAFAERLQARLDAPHNLPASCAEILAELPLPASTS